MFPKLDGTNASVWLEQTPPGEFPNLKAGSRNRVISAEDDNQGFYNDWVSKHDERLYILFSECPDWIIYGEWLVPHTLKTYREGAWRQFYAFDVWDRKAEKHLHYQTYASSLKTVGINVLEPLAVITNPTEEQLVHVLNQNTYLIEDGAGIGEGIVVKNYGYINPFGRENHAKIVRNEFKEDARREFGHSEYDGKTTPEAMIVERAITASLVAKERAKIETQVDPEQFRRQMIPRLLDTMFYVLITEELYETMSKLKLFGATVDFKKLRGHCIATTKKFASDLF